MDTEIDISRIHFPVTTLGPGRRIGIWFQGCSIRCPGCVSADTWGFGRGNTTIEELLAVVSPWLKDADGVTISGGEPFDQPEALIVLLQALKLTEQQDVLVYSGHPIERLGRTLSLASGLIDALISDPYDESASQTLLLRGSDNQRLHLLTKRGRQRFSVYNQPAEDLQRSLDVMFSDDGTVWLAGIPRRGEMLRLKELLNEHGHSIVTTAARRSAPRPR